MKPRSILITGASSGLGAALAEAYAGPEVTLGLLARRADRLRELQRRLEDLGARVLTYVADVADAKGTARAVTTFWDTALGVDLAIANAGLSPSDHLLQGDPAPLAEALSINVLGLANTLLPLIPRMAAQKAGQLVAIGSMAGFRGLPGKGAYCASKAAVKTLMDANRPVLRPHGIKVTTICPGSVRTELTAKNRYRMPFLMDAPDAAALIVRAIARGRATYVFPWQMRLIVPLLQCVPDRVLMPFSAARS